VPEPKAGVAVLATSTVIEKVTNRRERIALNLPLTESKEIIASGTVVIIEAESNDAVGLFIVFIAVESQQFAPRAASEK